MLTRFEDRRGIPAGYADDAGRFWLADEASVAFETPAGQEGFVTVLMPSVDAERAIYQVCEQGTLPTHKAARESVRHLLRNLCSLYSAKLSA